MSLGHLKGPPDLGLQPSCPDTADGGWSILQANQRKRKKTFQESWLSHSPQIGVQQTRCVGPAFGGGAACNMLTLGPPQRAKPPDGT